MIVSVGSGVAQLLLFAPMFNMVIATLCMVMDARDTDAYTMAEIIQNRFTHSWQVNGQNVLIKATGCIIECPQDAGEYSQLLDVIAYSMESAKQINIEITETAMMSTFQVVSENIRVLVDNGVAFSLDDYGTGYANISYSNHMPFQYIKLDKDLVWEAFKNEKARITLEHTVGMFNALNLNIVAEGIETEQMCQALTEFGCTYLQGWHFSKAVTREVFAEMVRAMM